MANAFDKLGKKDGIKTAKQKKPYGFLFLSKLQNNISFVLDILKELGSIYIGYLLLDKLYIYSGIEKIYSLLAVIGCIVLITTYKIKKK